MEAKELHIQWEEAAVDEMKFENVPITVQTEPSPISIKLNDFHEEKQMIKKITNKSDEDLKLKPLLQGKLFSEIERSAPMVQVQKHEMKYALRQVGALVILIRSRDFNIFLLSEHT